MATFSSFGTRKMTPYLIALKNYDTPRV